MKTRVIACRGVCAAALACLAACMAGCGLEHLIFGIQGNYLLTAMDTLALPGEQVTLKVRLESGGFLRDQPGIPLLFQCKGMPDYRAVTDSEGNATIPFKPAAPGDYLVTVSVEPGVLKNTPPEPVTLLVTCRKADAPLAIVDLDKTLVASGFKAVLVGDPKPMPQSLEVMSRIAKDYTVIYLTHRAEFLGHKSKAWLHDYGYPQGPMLLADTHEMFEKSGPYKSAVLETLRQRFRGRAIGIGDQISDVLAYKQNGIEPIMIITVPPETNAGDLRKLADSLQEVPETVQVVTCWSEIERFVFSGPPHLRPAAQAKLRRRADELTAQKKTGRDRLTSRTGSSEE
ncbi:MAG: hypothetical protein NT049_05815 [Planctomycetota bacterium]|nr:hypothetical protein [Planctomycetota bacterium]